MKDYGLIQKPTDKEVGYFDKDRRELLKYLGLGAAATLVGCGGGGPTGPGPIPTPSTPSNMTIHGEITDRITGQSLNGLDITFTGKQGQGVKHAVSANGAYVMENMPSGRYEVKVEGNGVIPHMNMDYNAVPDSPFSVLRPSSGFNDDFEEFFKYLARNPDWSQNKVKKWQTGAIPRELYVINVAHTQNESNYGALSSGAYSRFRDRLAQVNDESVPSMFANLIGPMSIVNGSPLGSMYKQGAIVIRFHNSQSNAPRNYDSNWVMQGGAANFNILTHENTNTPESQAVHNIAHEIFHNAFADHAYDHGYGNGLMDGSTAVTTLSPQEKMAARIVYHPDVHPGNIARDTNPR